MVARSGGGRPPAMMDVAKLAGVSHQTVSRVLNDSGKVTASTRERVLQAIAELGYRRNSVARALVTRKSGIIGILTGTSSHWGPSTRLLAVELAAREAGYMTLVAPLPDFSRDSLDGALDRFLGLAVEGIVIMAPVAGTGEDLQAFTAPVPIVVMTSADLAEKDGMYLVTVDQEKGGRMAVEHLIALGHTDIAHVRGPLNWFEARLRESGWRRAMEEHGLAIREPVGGGWGASTGYEAGKALVEQGMPQAVFAANDELALGLIDAFGEAGLSVPGDVSVVGFDDAPASAFFRPALTTVRQDFEELGEDAMRVLVRAIEGEAGIASMLVEPAMVVRDSTARA